MGLLEEIIEARRFRTMKAALERSTNEKDRPTGKLADLVKDVIESNALEDMRRAESDDH